MSTDCTSSRGECGDGAHAVTTVAAGFDVFGDGFVVPDWPAPAGVRAIVTTRRLPGNSRPPFDAFNLGLRSGEDELVVRSNRDLLQRALGLPSAPRWLRQLHGNHVARFSHVDAPGADRHAEPAEEPAADAAVTADAGVVLAILTADCLPLLLCADDGSEVAAVHAGWRGTASGVVQACVGRMRTAPDRLIGWLGPAIGPASFEVGPDVRSSFDRPGDESAFVANRPSHWLCDLHVLVRNRLFAAGVSRTFGGGCDTMTDWRWYSYRRDGARSGRFATLIWRSLSDASNFAAPVHL